MQLADYQQVAFMGCDLDGIRTLIVNGKREQQKTALVLNKRHFGVINC